MSSNQNTCERSEASSGGCHKDADPAGSAKVKLTYVMGNCHMYNLIVYPDRAHVYRKETPRFNANEVTEVLFDCVSPAIQKDSIRVELRGRATILDVALKEYSIDGVTSDGEYVSTKDQLIDEIRKCNKTMEMISARISRSETQRALLETYADKMSGKTNEDEADEPSALPPLKLDKHKDKKESKAEQQQQIIHHGSNDKKILNPYDPTTMDTLSRFLVTYEEQIEKLDLLILDGHDDLDKLAQRIEMLEKELIEIDMKQDGNMHKELSVLVEPRETGQVEMIISYVVGKCGWVPSYDIRMFNSDGSMKIIYYGMIVQSTGENWEKIPKMSLSTAEPGLGGTVPQLGLQKVQYKSGSLLLMGSGDKKAKKGCDKTKSFKGNVIQMGYNTHCDNSTLTRNCNVDHSSYCHTLNSANYDSILRNKTLKAAEHQMDMNTITSGRPYLQSRSNSSVCRDGNHLSGSLQRATSVLENNRHSKVLDTKHAFAQSILMKSGPTGACIHPNLHKSINSVPNNETVSSSRPHVNFEVPRPLAIIKSDGTEHRATVGLIDLSPNYDYVSVPKRSPYAFLKAEAVNQSSFYLLAGQTNIYSDNTFIGKIDFKDVAPGEKFSCQLGSEHGIKLAYKPMFKSKETSGSKSVVTFKQCIDVKNTFDRAIKLTVIDQLPVSGEEKIKIHLVEPSIKHPEKYDPKKPIRMNKNSNIEWDIDLKPGEQKELVFKFTVEHPANEELEVVCSEPNV